MEFPQDPLAFIDLMVDEHKRRWKGRRFAGEALKYMREAVDQQGQGEEFMRLYVHNDDARRPDPADESTDLAMLQLYEHWRKLHGLRPIEVWDGTTLRPWLPPESNPQLPAVFGDIDQFNDAFTRFPGEYGAHWRRLDALGNAIETYFREIQRHHVWSRPIGGGALRLYRFNCLNNIEVAPYTVLFWGFLKWADNVRRQLFDLPIEKYPHDEWSDISFMHRFNQHHFPWHDDVFGKGRCTRIDDQFGTRRQYKYPMMSQGYGVEFLQFHGDLIRAYNDWLERMGMPTASAWRSGRNHCAYILKYAFGWHYSRGGTNGHPLTAETYAPDLLDEDLSKFRTVAELGSHFERCGVQFHGMGHVENCDIRDVYTNNYSIRFFAWHTWIDNLFRKILEQGKPLYDTSTPLDQPIPGLCARFQEVPDPEGQFTGCWTYRSFHNEPDPNADPKWFVAELNLQQIAGEIVGELDSGYPEYRYAVSGSLNGDHVNYQTTPEWWDDREIAVLRAIGDTKETRGHVYEYVGHFAPEWPQGKDQVDAFTGTVSRVRRPDDPTKDGKVGSFITVRKTNKRVFFRDGEFRVPPGVTQVNISIWGPGGGGGSDGPGVGGANGADGGETKVERAGAALCSATGGKGGQHGVNQPTTGGAGGIGTGGDTQHAGKAGEDGDTVSGESGKGGDTYGPGDSGGERAGKHESGRNGFGPGGGGSGGQEAHTPGAGGGGGGYAEGAFSVAEGDVLSIFMGRGGRGGRGGHRDGGDGADGRVVITW